MDNEFKKRALKTVAHSIACINHIIDSLNSIGLVAEDKAFDGALYSSFNGLCDIAMDGLRFESVSEENEVYNKLIEVNDGNYEEVAEEVWEQYGLKEP